MLDAITDFLVSWVGPQLLVYLFVLGYLTLIICFYGGEKWKDFTDFDKIGFSFLTGFATWFLVIQPLSLYLLFVWNTFISFSNESYISAPPSSQYWFFLISLSFLIVLFFVELRTLNENKPFSGFDEVIGRITKGLIVFWFLSIFSQLFIYGALQRSLYRVYSGYLLPILLLNFLVLSIFILFLALTGKLDVNLEKVKSLIHINYNRRLLFCLVMVLVLIIVGIPVSGLLLLNPSVQDHGEIIHSITDDSKLTIGIYEGNGELQFASPPPQIFCKEYISNEYTIKTKLLSWVPIEPNFTVTGAKRSINKSTSKNYDIIDNTYFIINESRFHEINVTVNGYREVTLNPNENYDFTIGTEKYGNKTVINFIIINKMPQILYLDNVCLFLGAVWPRMPEYNLTNHTKTEGITVNSIERGHPRHICVHADLKSNQSGIVTLFFEKTEMDTTAN